MSKKTHPELLSSLLARPRGEAVEQTMRLNLNSRIVGERCELVPYDAAMAGAIAQWPCARLRQASKASIRLGGRRCHREAGISLCCA